MADWFLKPYYSLISSFFPNIVFHIPENKLDTIFTVAWIHAVDSELKLAPLPRKQAPEKWKTTTEIIYPQNYGKGRKNAIEGILELQKIVLTSAKGMNSFMHMKSLKL